MKSEGRGEEEGSSQCIFFAAVGDVHGHMHLMVDLLKKWESRLAGKFAFVLQVGDFEPHRDEVDLLTMAAPQKYKKLGDFPNYFEEKFSFPWPIYFIGGNHEPYGFLDQTPNGIKVTNNCYYLGRVACQLIKGLKVSGLSGIYQENKFKSCRPPVVEIYTRSNKDYIYFTEFDISQALDCQNVDILLLHDWPSDILESSQTADIARLHSSIKYDRIGNEYANLLINLLSPKLVLCGHMHYKYQSTVFTGGYAKTEIYCLAEIQQGDDAIAIFHATPDGNIKNVLFGKSLDEKYFE